MFVLIIVATLFVLAIACPFILPNKVVSKHKQDHV